MHAPTLLLLLAFLATVALASAGMAWVETRGDARRGRR